MGRSVQGKSSYYGVCRGNNTLYLALDVNFVKLGLRICINFQKCFTYAYYAKQSIRVFY